MLQCYYRDKLIDHRNHKVRNMGSGESDVRKITVDSASAATSYPFTQTVDFKNWNNTTPQYSYWSTYPQTIYLYQIKCPKRSCKANNWLQLDVVTPCKKCGAKLKAVSEVPEFTIAVDKT